MDELVKELGQEFGMKSDCDLFSIDSKDVCPMYRKARESKSDILKEINMSYNANQEYLDNEFSVEFPKEFFPRLSELFILKKIRESSFGNKVELKHKTKPGGPDVKINNFLMKKIFMLNVFVHNQQKNFLRTETFSFVF